ncbi:GT-D fold domain-containing glycosyltransferase [Campylobacter jejuni]|uniref:GT-D fold domain-containing glycosyltransferase n=1 Tax=Campylobacter jejuni TaxID=197 RepID=UPI0013753076|nr:GT-D fold domain-containing glycosyltransferase [Campylobacter jejuni]MBX2083210.1 DUF1792 domain-containing protein [Campylobacter jejuni]MCH3877100.1 GT-D fold domain-containing glycosyltransferase [Campylobacter jejuni]HED0491776.1 DUF1792 domain-containing protein [Campylobacter jejuni]HED0523058.1 DUF1792 domain-containing protein [Campylobacter jejuni]HED0573939.1 DUF1792 domain-containing protein [Campylobacter jejuni]
MKYSLRRFLKNIAYMAKYNLKELNNRTEILTTLPSFIDRIKYEIKDDLEDIVLPKIMDNFETLKYLIESDKSFIRFGDGEYSIMEGKGIAFQKYDEKLAKNLEEIIMTNHEKLLIGIAREYFYSTRCCHDFVREFCLGWSAMNYKKIKKYIQQDKIYGSTGVSQAYAAYKIDKYDFEKHYVLVKKLLSQKEIVVFCGDKIFNNIKYNILEGISKIEYVYGPTKHAYDNFENLKRKMFEISKNKILIFALGPAGKSLAYEAFKEGYRVLDFGHVFKDYDSYKKSILMNKEEIANFFAPDE